MTTARTDPCTRCQRHHAPPPCDHDASAPCHGCGRPRGYRWTGDDGQAGGDGKTCWRCATGIQEAAP